MGQSGSTVVVLGATGAVGQAAVRAAVSAGRRVVAVGGDRAELAALRVLHPGDADLRSARRRSRTTRTPATRRLAAP